MKKKIWLVNKVMIGLAILLTFLLIFGTIGMFGFKWGYFTRHSCSMTHFTDFDRWWEMHNITYSHWDINKENFQAFPYNNGLDRGLFIAKMVKPEHLDEGDIIAVGKSVHRLVNVFDDGYNLTTKGDANMDEMEDEIFFSPKEYTGKVIYFLPFFGFGAGDYPEKCYGFGNDVCIFQCIKETLHEEKDCLDLEDKQKDYCYYGLKMCDNIKDELIQYDCEMFYSVGEYFDDSSR